MKLTCPHCEMVGDLDCPEGFHPEDIFCGCCETLFPYSPSVWQILDDDNQEFEGAMGSMYLRPKSVPKPELAKPIKEMSVTEFLDTLPLRVVLQVFKQRSWPRDPYHDNDTLPIGFSGRRLTIGEVKDYLDTKENVPHKGKKVKLPPTTKRMVGSAEVPTLKQGKMSRDSLVQIARRSGWVKWNQSGTVEQLRFIEGQVHARAPNGSKIPHIIQGGAQKIYNCKEVPR